MTASHARRSRTAAIAWTAAAIVLVTGGVGVLLRPGAKPSCESDHPPLEVVAAPDIAPAVAEIAEATTTACQSINVTQRDPAEVPTNIMKQPAVWIPDSSLWLAQNQQAENQQIDSIAASPVVVAVAEGLARRMGWPGRRLELSRLLAADPGTETIRLSLPDPPRSAAATAALLGLQAAAARRPDGRALLAAALHNAVQGLRGAPEELLAGLTGSAPVALPVTEQAVWAHNTTHRRAATIVAADLTGDGTTLDYPFVVLATDPGTRADAGRLRAALHSPTGQRVLTAHGFRIAGSAPDARPASHQAVEAAIRTLEAVSQGTRLLAVIDISGSMGERVPGAGRATRLDLTREAAARALTFYPDDAQVGLWVFSTNLSGRADHRQLAPIGPLGAAGTRQRLASALATVRHVQNGGTGLYDTVLASVRTVRSGWRAGRVNSVVLLSDGRNDDGDGISLGQLLDRLRRENDLRRPVPVITIAFGPDSDADTLGAISAATGGTRYLSSDPRQIGDVFLDAIGQRPCRPRC